jgi:hypothetical protein
VEDGSIWQALQALFDMMRVLSLTMLSWRSGRVPTFYDLAKDTIRITSLRIHRRGCSEASAHSV